MLQVRRPLLTSSKRSTEGCLMRARAIAILCRLVQCDDEERRGEVMRRREEKRRDEMRTGEEEMKVEET